MIRIIVLAFLLSACRPLNQESLCLLEKDIVQVEDDVIACELNSLNKEQCQPKDSCGQENCKNK